MNIICFQSKREESLGLKDVSRDQEAQKKSQKVSAGKSKSLNDDVGRDSFFWTI